MTDWKELARKHEDSANHYARRCYDLEALNAELVEALEEIQKGEGAFSRDPLKHASNTIANMTRIATAALEKARGES